MFSGGQRFALVLYRYGRWIEFQASEHLRLTSHLQCPVEQLACDARTMAEFISARFGSWTHPLRNPMDPLDRAPKSLSAAVFAME